MRHTQALRQFIILASHYLCLLLSFPFLSAPQTMRARTFADIPPYGYFTCD